MEEIIKQLKETVNHSILIEESLQILEKNFDKTHPFYPHSLRTGLILQEMGADEKTIACGILHHIPIARLLFQSVTPAIQREIIVALIKTNRLRNLCSPEKTPKLKPLQQWEKTFLNQQAENLRRMFFAIARDIRPLFVTLAGRLDEMRNLALGYPKEEQLKRSAVVLEILAPLAYGLGLGEIKGQLEDLAFPYLYPKEYGWLQENLKEKHTETKNFIERIKPRIVKILSEKQINVLEVQARAKHYFSLYQKLLRHNMDFEEIYDLVALRIIVPDIETCYQTLGAIHNIWTPLPGRIKDYISIPKINGYRALHTTVTCEENRIIEIQIKTPEMHQEAEYGIAAHLAYKVKVPREIYKHQFYWLEQLRRWREEIKDPQEISGHLQSIISKDWVFVFTPRGDILNLPKGSTPVDFAYSVHTTVGEHCEGVKVNGKIASLKQTLKTGDLVEIITDKNKTPSSDWLRFVKTTKAKKKIRAFLEKAHGISFAKSKKEALKEKVSLIKKILPIGRKKTPGVLVAGEAGIAVRLSKCCSPEPGEEIQAFITKGEGASLHRTNCPNLKEIEQRWPQRIVEASWKN